MPKRLEAMIIFLLILLLFGKNIQSKSLDEQVGSKYQFDLFENEEGCKTLYKSEEMLVKKLFAMRTKFDRVKFQIQQFKFQNGIKKNIEEFLQFQTWMLQDFNKITNEFPTIRDYNGGLFLKTGYNLILTRIS